ncbi:hypothetical protein [Sphingomonas sp.]|uniref:hypothetical protein n=1 Tax=Sphingomonas sp. TaxID=28214 RepID=UPI0035A8CFB1|nr:hypothetical protein [Sphingobium sp.]
MSVELQDVDELIHLEIEREGVVEIIELEIHPNVELIGHVREQLGLEIDVHIFERERDEPLLCGIEGRKHLRLLAHPARVIEVVVQYEHHAKKKEFAPSATVFKVLQWAVSKAAYGLDPTNAAKANLILPGADEPLPRERTIGSFTKPGHQHLVVDLTLKDFTNG